MRDAAVVHAFLRVHFHFPRSCEFISIFRVLVLEIGIKYTLLHSNYLSLHFSCYINGKC